jgi:phosphoglycerate dehydrogenase-like enzyme
MNFDVVCLRPAADFERVGVTPPDSLSIAYRGPNDPDVAPLLQHARALILPAVGPKIPAGLFEGTALKLVQVTGAGVDRLDLAALQRLGIPVANVPGGSNSAVAEYAVTAASTLLRRFAWADFELRQGNYAAFRARMVGDNLAGLEGLLVGIIGFGTIGMSVGRAFYAAGARLCYFDPAGPNRRTAAELGARAVSFDELLSQSDEVTLHAPLVPATRNLIGREQLARMKPGAFLIQASRGGIVDEAALAERLASGDLGGAAVDVYSTEPPASDNPLFALGGEAARRLLLTPHIAGVTRQSWAFLFRSTWNNIERVLLRGEAPLNQVSPV